MEGEVEARWAFIGKWEIIHAIDKHFQLFWNWKTAKTFVRQYHQNEICSAKLSLLRNKQLLWLICLFFVLKMFYACYFLFCCCQPWKKWHPDNKNPTIQNSTFTIPSIEDGDYISFISYPKFEFEKYIQHICRELTVALR